MKDSLGLYFLAIICALTVMPAIGVKGAPETNAEFTAADWQWIGLETQAGNLSKVTIEKGKIPTTTLQRLMPTKDERKLTKDEIKALAKQCGLFERTDVNPHLRYKDGDIAYWSEQDLQAWEIRLEFLARRWVLLAADDAKAYIPQQGDLSHWASSVYGAMYQEMRPTWEKAEKK